MHSDFNSINLAAPAVLALLAAVFGLALSAVVIVVALLARKRVVAIGMAGVAGSGVLFYCVALFGLSFFSQEQVLPLGGEKYFCEIDCHIAYSIASVERVKTLGNGPSRVNARGEFYVVTLRTRFDETTISSSRPRNAPLTPGPREAVMVAADGREFPVSASATAALGAEGLIAPLRRPLIPGEQYVTHLAFDLPVDAKNPRLLLTSKGWDYHWMIGQENSWLHKKTWLALDPPTAVAGR